MKEIRTPLPEKHIFVCVNERDPKRVDTGQGPVSVRVDHCSKVGGLEIFQKIKTYVMSHGLTSRIWVTKTKCLGFCNPVGTTIAVYPEQKIFTEVKVEEVDKLLISILSLD